MKKSKLDDRAPSKRTRSKRKDRASLSPEEIADRAEFARSYKRYAEARALPKANRPLPSPSTTP